MPEIPAPSGVKTEPLWLKAVNRKTGIPAGVLAEERATWLEMCGKATFDEFACTTVWDKIPTDVGWGESVPYMAVAAYQCMPDVDTAAIARQLFDAGINDAHEAALSEHLNSSPQTELTTEAFMRTVNVIFTTFTTFASYLKDNAIIVVDGTPMLYGTKPIYPLVGITETIGTGPIDLYTDPVQEYKAFNAKQNNQYSMVEQPFLFAIGCGVFTIGV